MKMLHTSDFHLGLRLCEAPMNGELEAALGEIAEIARREECTAVLAAGDLYDRSNPSPESVAIFDRFVTELAQSGIALLAVSGNHDSPERVAYLSELLREAGVFFSPLYDGNVSPVTLTDEFGEADFWLLPFLRPVNVRAAVPEFEGESFTEAVRCAVERLPLHPERRNVLLTHQYVVGSLSDGADSSDGIPEVGGGGAVSAEVFAPFDYAALGHLHGAHPVTRETVRYSGSPIKCSFAEAGDEKSVTLVELREKGSVTVRPIPLHPIRDLREFRGTYAEAVSPEVRGILGREDYLRIILTDEEDIPDVLAKLRTIYPNLLRLSYDNARTRAVGEYTELSEDRNGEALSPRAVFAELYEKQNGLAPDDEVMALADSIFREVTA